jgi:hypothetical protein
MKQGGKGMCMDRFHALKVTKKNFKCAANMEVKKQKKKEFIYRLPACPYVSI